LARAKTVATNTVDAVGTGALAAALAGRPAGLERRIDPGKIRGHISHNRKIRGGVDG
jgi:hypothetical protein